MDGFGELGFRVYSFGDGVISALYRGYIGVMGKLLFRVWGLGLGV